LFETKQVAALEQVEEAIAEAVEMEGDMEVFLAYLASLVYEKGLITASCL
jgi:hypothetical protein